MSKFTYNHAIADRRTRTHTLTLESYCFKYDQTVAARDQTTEKFQSGVTHSPVYDGLAQCLKQEQQDNVRRAVLRTYSRTLEAHSAPASCTMAVEDYLRTRSFTVSFVIQAGLTREIQTGEHAWHKANPAPEPQSDVSTASSSS